MILDCIQVSQQHRTEQAITPHSCSIATNYFITVSGLNKQRVGQNAVHDREVDSTFSCTRAFLPSVPLPKQSVPWGQRNIEYTAEIESRSLSLTISARKVSRRFSKKRHLQTNYNVKTSSEDRSLYHPARGRSSQSKYGDELPQRTAQVDQEQQSMSAWSLPSSLRPLCLHHNDHLIQS